MTEEQDLRKIALRLAITAFCPAIISAPQVVKAAEVFEQYSRSNAGNTLKDFVAVEVNGSH